MSEALLALLAVPPAIDASRNMISSLITRLSGPSDKQHAKEIDSSIAQIAKSLVLFSDFTENLRKWKIVHNITQIVLYNDMYRIFSYNISDSKEFSLKISENYETAQQEFYQVNNGLKGAVMALEALPTADFQLDGIPASVTGEGKNWGEYIIDRCQTGATALQEREFRTLHRVVSELHRNCTRMNIIADEHMKAGFAEITSVMAEVRAKIQTGLHVSY